MRKIYISLAFKFQNLSTFFRSFSLKMKYGNLKIRRGDSDIRVYKQIFIDETYYFLPQYFIPDVIIDAGANVGYSPIWFASMFVNSKIIAIEPVSSNFSILKENCLPYKNIIPIKAGLWFEKSILKIQDRKTGSWGFQTIASDDLKLEGIESVTVSELIDCYNLNKIDIFKIDIEGAEFELFNFNSEKWISYVNIFMIETHDKIKPGTSELIDEKLKPFGFHKFITKELVIYINKDFLNKL